MMEKLGPHFLCGVISSVDERRRATSKVERVIRSVEAGIRKAPVHDARALSLILVI